MAVVDTWDRINQLFVEENLKKHFGISSACTRKLLDYAHAQPFESKFESETKIQYPVSGMWLIPSQRLQHFLFVDAERGLTSKWIPGGKTFDQAMGDAKESSLNNLCAFLLSKKEHTLLKEVLPDERRWYRKYESNQIV